MQVTQVSLQVKFISGNAAITDNPICSSVQILQEIQEKIQAGHEGGYIKDFNGNTIGDWGLDVEVDEEAIITEEF